MHAEQGTQGVSALVAARLSLTAGTEAPVLVLLDEHQVHKVSGGNELHGGRGAGGSAHAQHLSSMEESSGRPEVSLPLPLPQPRVRPSEQAPPFRCARAAFWAPQPWPWTEHPLILTQSQNTPPVHSPTLKARSPQTHHAFSHHSPRPRPLRFPVQKNRSGAGWDGAPWGAGQARRDCTLRHWVFRLGLRVSRPRHLCPQGLSLQAGMQSWGHRGSIPDGSASPCSS